MLGRICVGCVSSGTTGDADGVNGAVRVHPSMTIGFEFHLALSSETFFEDDDGKAITVT